MEKIRFIGYFIVLVTIGIGQPACAASPSEINSARIKGLAFLYKSQKGDGTWSVHDALKVQTTATALEALINSGIKSGETYGSATAWLANAETLSIDALSRKISALAITGMNMKSQAQLLLAHRPTTDRQVWGAYPQYGVSFPDTPLGIGAIRLSGYSYAGQSTDLYNAVACEILPSQRADGGWSYTRSATGETPGIANSALLPTAITLLEVATLRTTYGWSGAMNCGTSYDLATSLNRAVDYLVNTKKSANGGFGENGASTPLQTALAYLAILAVNPGHAALTSAQDYLLGAGQQASDGSWQADPLATALVLKTMPKLSLNALLDTDRDGVPDEIELAISGGTSPTRADGRDLLAPGNGQAVPGVNNSILIASIPHLQPMVPLQMSPAGGTSYVLTAGALPPGITKDGAGVLSGTPTQMGTFSFSYSASGGAATLAQLIVVPADVPVDPSQLAQWLMPILMLLLE